MRDDFRADDARRARPVIDHDLFPEDACQFLCNRTARQIGAAAGRPRNDKTNRTSRIVRLRSGGLSGAKADHADRDASRGQQFAVTRLLLHLTSRVDITGTWL
jgi:hypothetical protein